jgi:hypothetical protein
MAKIRANATQVGEYGEYLLKARYDDQSSIPFFARRF